MPSALPMPSAFLLKGAASASKPKPAAAAPPPQQQVDGAANSSNSTSSGPGNAQPVDLSDALAQLTLMLHERSAAPEKPPASLASPRKLLVLDCNGFLCWRARRGSDTTLPARPPDASHGEFKIYLRPHARDFLKWCAARFHIVVWSTAMRRNLEPIVAAAFGTDVTPAAIFDQSACTDTGLTHPDNPQKRLLLKRLSCVWGAQSVSAFGTFGAGDTLLIDDSPYKAIDNPEHTAIHPIEWSALDADEAPISTALAPGGEVRRLLALVAEAADARSVVRGLSAELAGRGAPSATFWQSPEGDPVLEQVRRARARAVPVA